MQIRHVLLKVDDQDKALAFYTPVSFIFFEDTCGNLINLAQSQ